MVGYPLITTWIGDGFIEEGIIHGENKYNEFFSEKKRDYQKEFNSKLKEPIRLITKDNLCIVDLTQVNSLKNIFTIEIKIFDKSFCEEVIECIKSKLGDEFVFEEVSCELKII